MAGRCCGSTGTCACKIEGGRHVTVTGSGTSQDPFRVVANTSLAVADTTTFDIGLGGAGTPDDPWVLTVGYANTSRLTDIPDVFAESPTDGYVLTYDLATAQWVARPAVTADPGAVTAGDGLAGDGSLANPLVVDPDALRYITVSADGVGISDDGLASLVVPYADAAARDAAPAPARTGALSMLATDPGQVDYWTGTVWEPIISSINLDIQPGQVLSLSGGYAGGAVTQYVRQITGVVTDANGVFEVIPAADLTGYAGVLSVSVQPLGTTGWTPVVRGDTNRLIGTAFRLDSGVAYSGYTLSAVVTALLY